MLGAETGAKESEMRDTGLPTTGTGTLTLDTSVKRSGTRSYKFDSTGANLAIAIKPTFTANATIYGRAYLYITNLPGSDVAVVQMSQGGGAVFQIKITSGGALQLFQNTTQVGSDSSALSTSTWYRVEWFGNINGSGDDDIALRIDGTVVASGQGAYWASGTFSDCTIGWIDTPGASKVMQADDIAINNGTGTRNSSYPGNGSILLSKSTGDNAIGGWRDGFGGSTNVWDGVANIPPAGLDEASQNTTSAIENYVSSATSNFDGNMQSYITAGVPSGSVIVATQGICVHAEDRTTGTNSGAVLIVSNPAESAEVSFTFGNDAGAAGTFPTSWRTAVTAILDYPSVVLGTAPVMRVGKRTATTRPVACCGLFIVFEYQSSAPPIPPRPLRVWARR